MNRKERESICSMIADWEYSGGASGAAAYGTYECSEQLRIALEIKDEDLDFYRCSASYKACFPTVDSDPQWDAYIDLWDRLGKDRMNDLIDDKPRLDALIQQEIEAQGAAP